MNVLITAGGGGHFAPALSVIKALDKKTKLLVVGRKYAFEGDRAESLEYAVAKSLRIPFYPLVSGRLQRSFTVYTIPSILKLPIGFFQALSIVSQFKPSVVITFGGYVSLPVTLASFLFRIPVVVHEQTLEAGLTNKIASMFAKKVCVSFQSSEKFFPQKKVVLTGNPIREEIIKAKHEKLSLKNKTLKTIYITGGSSGSHKINVLVKDCVEKLLSDFVVIHQTGDAKEFNDYDALSDMRNNLSLDKKKRYILKKFVDPFEVGLFLKEADLVVCRSGINTVCELLYMEKPSLLIPLPWSQQNEQQKNAEFLKKLGLSQILSQQNATSKSFYEAVLNMLKNPSLYSLKGDVNEYIKEDAAERIVKVIEETASKK